MQKKIKILLAYFPITLLICQMAANVIWFIDKDFYFGIGFYLNTLIGSSLFFGIFLTAFTYIFKFCSVSRYCAIAQILFSVNYLVVQQDNLYNIVFQIIVGVLALCLTANHFADKFPLKKLGQLKRFVHNVWSEGSCKKGIEHHYQQTKTLIRHRNDITRNKL